MSPHNAAPAAGDSNAPPLLPPELLQRLDALSRFAFVVSDCLQPDNPIVHASPSFLEMTGYQEHEVLGRNCRFLNGPDTERRKLMELRDAIREGRATDVCLLNFRKDGRPFWNQLHMAPLRDVTGRVTHFVGIQADVTRLVTAARAASAANAAAAAVSNDDGGSGAPAAEGRELEAAASAAAAAAALDAARAELAGARLRLETAIAAANGDGSAQNQTAASPDDALPTAAAPVAAAAAPELAGQQEEDVIALGLAQSDESDEGVEEVEEEERREAAAVAAAVRAAGPLPHLPCGTLPTALLMPLLRIPEAFVLQDATVEGLPIVFASAGFVELTGYSREEVMGQSCCGVLCGPGTEGPELNKLRAALTASPPEPVTVTLLQFRKGGDPFWCSLHVAPARDADGRVEYIVGVFLDTTARGAGGGATPAAPQTAAAPERSLRLETNAVAAGGERPIPRQQLPAGPVECTLLHRLQQSSVVAACRVAARGVTGRACGLRRSLDDQVLPRRTPSGRTYSGSLPPVHRAD